MTPTDRPVPARSRRPRPTLRLRLALLYGGLLIVVGVAALAMSVVLLDRTVRQVVRFEPGSRVPAVDQNGDLVYLDADRFEDALIRDARGDLMTTGALAFGVVVLVGGVAGYVIAGRALAPVSRVTATAKRLSTETLHERIGLAGPSDELKELADTFDDMLARLDAAFDAQRQFVANASHELRTPLAVIRTEADVALADPNPTVADLRGMAEVVRDATVRADRMVEALLVLARGEARAGQGPAVREPIDLAGLVPPALAAVAGESRTRGLVITSDVAEARVRGDPSLIERLVGNLVENAVRHNVDGGWVTVATGTRGQSAWLTIENTGTPTDPVAGEDLFAPFQRGGTARTSGRGAGLGLSIVRAVTAAHDGEVSATRRSEGGLLVSVTLPAAADSVAPAR